MDVLALLEGKLNFVLKFYETASEPFHVVMRKIELHEKPYDDFDPEHGEPPFLSEWLYNSEAVNLLGKACLCLVQQAFKDYLDGFIDRSYGYGLIEKPNKNSKMKGKSWFEKYRNFFQEVYFIDWGKATVDVSFIEDINLVRNAIQHNGTVYDLSHQQTEDHFRRFPNSPFVNELDKLLFESEPEVGAPYRITVTLDNLSEAIQSIYDFCCFLDAEWQKRPI